MQLFLLCRNQSQHEKHHEESTEQRLGNMMVCETNQ
jgi:hypothetical protein